MKNITPIQPPTSDTSKDEELNQKLKTAKSIPLTSLLTPNTYFDFNFGNDWFPAKINAVLPDGKYDISFFYQPNKEKRNLVIKLSSKMSFFREHIYCYNNISTYYESLPEIKEVKQYIHDVYTNTKTTPYEMVQFLNGYLLDVILNVICKLDDEKEGLDLVLFIIDIIAEVISFSKKNIDKLKYLKNRHLILVDVDYAKLASLELLVNSLSMILIHNNYLDNIYARFTKEDVDTLYVKYKVEKKMNKEKYALASTFNTNENNKIQVSLMYFVLDYFCKGNENSIYETLFSFLYDTELFTQIPLYLIQIIAMQYKALQNFKGESLTEEQQKKIYDSCVDRLSSLSEVELKEIRNPNFINDVARVMANFLYNKNQMNEETIDVIIPKTKLVLYYSLRCLQSENLEKKINAINTLNEVFNDIVKYPDEYGTEVYHFLIENKVIQILLGENVHDEVLKRSIPLFHILSQYTNNGSEICLPNFTYDLLWDNYLNKHESVSSQIENIICNISNVLPEEKKSLLYNKLKSLSSQIIANSPNKFFDFVSRLTRECISPYIPKEDENILEREDKLYGIPLLYDYILDKDGENTIQTVSMCNRYLVDILSDTRNVSEQIVYKFIEILLNNIINKTSTVQSIKLIQSIVKERNSKEMNITIKNLDNTYDIITIIVDDLHSYLKDKKEGKKQFSLYKDEINLNKRLDFLFFFQSNEYISYVLDFKGKEHLQIVYETFISYAKENLDMLYTYIQNNINNFSEETTIYFFNEILSKEEYFDPSAINDKGFALFRKVFYKINSSKIKADYDEDDDYMNQYEYDEESQKIYPLVFDTRRHIRVRDNSIKGIDILYNIILSNISQKVQDKASNLLSNLCTELYSYQESFCSSYWKSFIDHLSSILSTTYQKRNTIGLSGLVNLIEKIYSNITYRGKVPEREDTETASGESEVYKFRYVERNKEYKIKVGNTQSVLDVRWRVGYYYDLNVNEVVFLDEEGKHKLSLLNDLENFRMNYSPKNTILVYSEKDILIKLKNNPKDLIENNEEIKKILLSLLHDYKNNYIDNAWKLINKIPSNLLVDDNIKKIGMSLLQNEQIIDISNLFDKQSLYVITFTLNNILNYINNDLKSDERQKEYLSNFVSLYNGKKILREILDSFTTESFMKKNKTTNIIGFECLISLLKLLEKIYLVLPSTDNKDEDDTSFLIAQATKLVEIIIKVSSTLDSNKRSYSIEMYTENLEKMFLSSFNRKDSIDSELESKYNYFKYYNNWDYHQRVVEDLLSLTELLCDNSKIDYISYLLLNSLKSFKSIFVYQYILIINPEIKEVLFNCLSSSLRKDNSLTLKYLEIVFTKDIIDYINKNDHRGLYYFFISSIIKKYYKNQVTNNDETIKEIVSLLIKYIKEATRENEKLIEGTITLLDTIISTNKNAREYLSNTYDIYEILLNQCILSKMKSKPLDYPNAKCISDSSQEIIYKTMNTLCKEDGKLTKKIIDILSQYHLSGFWKDKHSSNWKINLSKDEKGHFVGLKNMGCTCYMNSILQQFFMIKELRETILGFEPDIEQYKTNREKCSFYQIKKLFASLKYYESQFYNPKTFCANFDGQVLDIHEQMDADEFYSRLIDKLEEYVKDNTEYKDLFKAMFGGLNVDELLFKECGHKRENEFFFNSIQLQVSGKRSLEESLSSYVKGEMMEGNNSIFCEECKKKIPALKRQSIKYLPNKLVLVLKRFEFDYDNMVKYKLNDYFEFPNELDMFPYTQEYMNNNSIKKQKMYDLNGVVIHVGTSESGHYYSLIKDPSSKEEDTWYEFNDTNVKPFDIDNLARDAFGGTEEIFNRETKKKEVVDKNENAYILIYTKRDCEETPHFVSKIDKEGKAPQDIMDFINNEMYQYWVLKNISSDKYQKFIIELLKNDFCHHMKNIKFRNDNFDIAIDTYSTLPKRHFSQITSNISSFDNENETIGNTPLNDLFIFGTVYFFNIIIRCKEKRNIPEYCDIIKLYLNQNVNNSIWLIEEFSNQQAIQEYLIDCANSQIQKTIVGIIYCALLCISKTNNDSIIFRLMNTLITTIKEKVNICNLEYVYNVLYRIISLHYNDKVNIYLDYLKEIKFNEYISFYFKHNKKINPEYSFVLKEIPNVNKHSLLTEKQHSKYVTEEETKVTELGYQSKVDHFLISILIILSDSEALFNMIEKEENIFILSQGKTRLNCILLSDKLYLLCTDNAMKNKDILYNICNFLNQCEYNEMDLALMILRRFIFTYQDSETASRRKDLFDYIGGLISNNISFYSYIDKITDFIIKIYRLHSEIFEENEDEINNKVIGPLAKFYTENKIPPKFFPNKTGVVLYKKEKNSYGNVSSSQYRLFEEASTKKSLSILKKLNLIIRKQKFGDMEDKKIFNIDEELTDFKFLYGDKVKYEGYICKVIKVLDELIEIEYDKEEAEMRKRPRTEWVDTSNKNLEIEDLV